MIQKENKLLSILFIFPEGNIANNPNFLSIILLLDEKYKIYIIQQREKIDYINENINIISLNNLTNEKCFNEYLQKINSDFSSVLFSLIICVDQGIIFGNYLSNLLNVPKAYISYEIMFADEWEQTLKKKEIIACKDVSFAICQDTTRSYLLSKENNIPASRIINIPVAEAFSETFDKSNKYLHNKLNIPLNKKIVLYMGSIGQWSMTNSLIESVHDWPEDWVLVLHPRYGIDSSVTPLIEKINKNSNIYLSEEPVFYTYEMENIISSCDLGIALYDPDILSPNTGKNILFIGLSSGKFSMFMKYKIPVLVNNNTNISDFVSQFNLGYVFSCIKEIKTILVNSDIAACKNDCEIFFKKYLDFNLYKDILLKIIEKAILNGNAEHYIKNNFQINNLINDKRLENNYNSFLTIIKKQENIIKNYEYLNKNLIINKIKRKIKNIIGTKTKD